MVHGKHGKPNQCLSLFDKGCICLSVHEVGLLPEVRAQATPLVKHAKRRVLVVFCIVSVCNTVGTVNPYSLGQWTIINLLRRSMALRMRYKHRTNHTHEQTLSRVLQKIHRLQKKTSVFFYHNTSIKSTRFSTLQVTGGFWSLHQLRIESPGRDLDLEKRVVNAFGKPPPRHFSLQFRSEIVDLSILVGGWVNQPIWNICAVVKMGLFLPRFVRGENKQCWNPYVLFVGLWNNPYRTG